MNSNANVGAWLADAPSEVRETTEGLLAKVQTMRANQVIYPSQDDILNALAYVAPADVKVVILGQDPYHGPNQAMGLSFSVPAGEKLPPSLRNIYKELSDDLDVAPPSSGDLTKWAQQGVLLLNATLTVKEHTANSHAKLGWQVLTNYLVEQCFRMPQPVVFMAWGRNAIKVIEQAQGIVCADVNGPSGPTGKLVLKSTHPSPLSANRASGGLPAFMGSQPFSAANAFLVEHGVDPIAWDCVD